jgi:hypothetical protein
MLNDINEVTHLVVKKTMFHLIIPESQNDISNQLTPNITQYYPQLSCGKLQCSATESGLGCCTENINMPIRPMQVSNITAIVSNNPDQPPESNMPFIATEWLSERMCTIRFVATDPNFTGFREEYTQTMPLGPLVFPCECKWPCDTRPRTNILERGLCQCGLLQYPSNPKPGTRPAIHSYTLWGTVGWNARVDGSRSTAIDDNFNVSLTITTKYWPTHFGKGSIGLPSTAYNDLGLVLRWFALNEMFYFTSQLQLGQIDFKEIVTPKKPMPLVDGILSLQYQTCNNVQGNLSTPHNVVEYCDSLAMLNRVGLGKSFQGTKYSFISPVTNICPGGKDCIEPSKIYLSTMGRI